MFFPFIMLFAIRQSVLDWKFSVMQIVAHFKAL